MKIAPSRTTSIDLPDLVQLLDEFGFIPATKYHRLAHLYKRYRKEVVAISSRSMPAGLVTLQQGGLYSAEPGDTKADAYTPMGCRLYQEGHVAGL